MAVFVAGVALAAVATTESVTRFEDLADAVWTPIMSLDPTHPSRLSPASEPFSSTFWGYGPMPIAGSFQLNIATSGPVRVNVASVQSQQGLTTIFDRVDTRFFEDVPVSGGTFQVQIENEGTEPVEILEGSNVIGRQGVTTHEKTYPYVSWGSLVAVLGVLLVIVGFISKPKKRLSRKWVLRSSLLGRIRA